MVLVGHNLRKDFMVEAERVLVPRLCNLKLLLVEVVVIFSSRRRLLHALCCHCRPSRLAGACEEVPRPMVRRHTRGLCRVPIESDARGMRWVVLAAR
jgi:hypothetical protein